MEKINSTSQMDFQVILKLNEQEARALNAITVYGVKNFLKAFYKEMGKTYLEPNEQGIKSLFETISSELPKHLSKFDKCRKTWKDGSEK